MSIKKKLICVLACRNGGTRLYGKPLQSLDINKNITIIEQQINCLSKIKSITRVALAISNGIENKIYQTIAKKKSIKFVYGSEKDVLSRLIKCGRRNGATDVLRITTENPFPFYQLINKLWSEHLKKSADATFLDKIIDGCGFEIISMKALIKAHKKANEIEREHCTLYIRNNIKKFKVLRFLPPKKFIRRDLRLTVDYPDDLMVCRKIYTKFKKQAPFFNLNSIINFLDNNPNIKKIIKPYVKKGYSSMYRFKK